MHRRVLVAVGRRGPPPACCPPLGFDPRQKRGAPCVIPTDRRTLGRCPRPRPAGGAPQCSARLPHSSSRVDTLSPGRRALSLPPGTAAPDTLPPEPTPTPTPSGQGRLSSEGPVSGRGSGSPRRLGPSRKGGPRLPLRGLAGVGAGSGQHRAWGLPSLRPPGEGQEQQLLERQKLLFPCWVNICRNPRKWLAGERAGGSPGPRPRPHGPAAGPAPGPCAPRPPASMQTVPGPRRPLGCEMQFT